MSTSVPIATRHTGPLLLADISGYTSFLSGVAEAHQAIIVDSPEPPMAYTVLSHLLDTIVASIGPSLRLAKFEGDAVFAVADEGAIDGPAALDLLHACYDAFRAELGLAGSHWTCQCDACALIGALDLKFVLHHGAYIAQPIAGREELLGPDVNVAHRLLKNHVREVVGSVPYALITDAAASAMAIPTDGMVAAHETYDGAGTIAVRILVLSESPAAAQALS
jgi:Protein of unknown function (DUF2652)